MSPTFNTKTTADEVAAACSAQIRGKVILVTGVSPKGIGAYFVLSIAKQQPKLLILAGRSVSKAAETAKEIEAVAPAVETRLLELDLGSQKQVRKAAKEVLAYEESIDVLVNNAGIMACSYGLTEDGLEKQFGTMHIGHFLFTNLIMDNLLKGSGARVVSVSSDGFRLSPVRFNDIGFDNGKTYNKWRAYGQAKTSNMLFAVSLAEKLGKKGIQAVSLHPGVVPSNLGRDNNAEDFAALTALDRELGNYQGWWEDFPWKTEAEGSATHVFAAFEPTLADHNGAFLADSQVQAAEDVQAWARDRLDAAKLWKVSEEFVSQKFEY